MRIRSGFSWAKRERKIEKENGAKWVSFNFHCDIGRPEIKLSHNQIRNEQCEQQKQKESNPKPVEHSFQDCARIGTKYVAIPWWALIIVIITTSIKLKTHKPDSRASINLFNKQFYRDAIASMCSLDFLLKPDLACFDWGGKTAIIVTEWQSAANQQCNSIQWIYIRAN